MVNLLKHKWIYYALSMLLAVIAAHESTRLLLLLGILISWLLYKHEKPIHLLMVGVLGCLFFLYTEKHLEQLEQPVALPNLLTLTSEYKVSGAVMRGFMKTQDGTNVYVVYTFPTEHDLRTFDATSQAGMQFQVHGLMEEPEPPAHRYNFQMDRYLTSKGAVGILQIERMENVQMRNSVATMLAKQRFHVKRHIEQVFPKSLVAEAQALIIGIQENVDIEMTRAYQKLGITHLFAISGLHVALVSMLFFQVLLRLHVRREFATIVLLIILPIYALLAGGAPSVWRAVSVVELILICKYFRIHIPAHDAIAISFIVFVTLQPGAVYQIGFQLSYLATISLIFSSQILARQPSWWRQSFYMTFVCQLFVYPLLLWNFYELSLSSFLTNIVFVPLFSFVILPINLLLFIISYIPGNVVYGLFLVYEPLRGLLASFIMWLQALPYQMWVPGKPSHSIILLMYGSVVIALYLLDIQQKLYRVMLVLLIPAMIIQVTLYAQRDLQITFLNVGQGDSILIELPYRRGIYLIDAGGLLRFEGEAWKQRNNLYEVGRQVVVPYLKGRGIASVDVLILTHADADHVEGAEEVVKEIGAKAVHVAPNSLNNAAMEEFLQEAIKRSLPIQEKMAGDGWQRGQYHFDYLWPQQTVYEGNNSSLVLLLKMEGFRALFTGDLEEAGEQQLLQTHKEQIEQVHLLKAGHHGSKTSSIDSFVAHTMPKLTIFTAGKDNRYGHPHEEVVARFQTRNLPYLTTGVDGTVTVIVRNGKLYLEK